MLNDNGLAEYSVLRCCGYSQADAAKRAGVEPDYQHSIERLFLYRRSREGGSELPKWARDDKYVKAVQASGGF